jgi:hypothetical protein
MHLITYGIIHGEQFSDKFHSHSRFLVIRACSSCCVCAQYCIYTHYSEHVHNYAYDTSRAQTIPIRLSSWSGFQASWYPCLFCAVFHTHPIWHFSGRSSHGHRGRNMTPPIPLPHQPTHSWYPNGGLVVGSGARLPAIQFPSYACKPFSAYALAPSCEAFAAASPLTRCYAKFSHTFQTPASKLHACQDCC